MEYQEKHPFRTRRYRIEEYGVSVNDDGAFKSTRRFFSFDDIGNEINYTRDEVASKILLIFGLISSSIYLGLKYELIGYVLAFAFISISVSMAINVIKNTSYIGTVLFKNSATVNDSELYLKTDIPLSEKATEFIEALRYAKIEYYFNKIIETKHKYIVYQQDYQIQLNGLKERLKLNNEEYDLLNKRLTIFFKEQNVGESHQEEE
ncbi:MAG: hypothetical protein R2824_17115 [Saprospiraceae bacterium]|nr:hypothetical protein [Lewinella sp.]